MYIDVQLSKYRPITDNTTIQQEHKFTSLQPTTQHLGNRSGKGKVKRGVVEGSLINKKETKNKNTE